MKHCGIDDFANFEVQASPETRETAARSVQDLQGLQLADRSVLVEGQTISVALIDPPRRRGDEAVTLSALAQDRRRLSLFFGTDSSRP